MYEIVATLITGLFAGGGLGIFLKHRLDMRKTDAEICVAEDTQIAKRSEAIMARLDTRIGALETELKECRQEHANSREQNGYLRGRVEELARQLAATNVKVGQDPAAAIALADSVALPDESGAHRIIGIQAPEYRKP